MDERHERASFRFQRILHLLTLFKEPRRCGDNGLEVQERKQRCEHSEKPRMDKRIAVVRSQSVIQLVQQQRSKRDEEGCLGGKGEKDVENEDNGVRIGCGLKTLLAKVEESVNPIGWKQTDTRNELFNTLVDSTTCWQVRENEPFERFQNEFPLFRWNAAPFNDGGEESTASFHVRLIAFKSLKELLSDCIPRRVPVIVIRNHPKKTRNGMGICVI